MIDIKSINDQLVDKKFKVEHSKLYETDILLANYNKKNYPEIKVMIIYATDLGEFKDICLTELKINNTTIFFDNVDNEFEMTTNINVLIGIINSCLEIAEKGN